MDEDTRITGEVLKGRYRLARRISEGVPARWEVTHPRVGGRLLAALWPPTAPGRELRRGAEIATTLRNRGVVQLLDFNCKSGASPLVVYEWLEATTRLSEIMARNGCLPAPRVAALVESVASTLSSAHRLGVVHQQLRPEDIYVVEDGQAGREWTKVDGFGVAAALARAGFWPQSPYHAPEPAANDGGGGDPHGDQYALAAIAYHMLTGASPIGPNADLAAPDPSPGDRPGTMSSSVDVVIRQALTPDPDERFDDVLQFARALRRAADADGNTQRSRRGGALVVQTRSLARLERRPPALRRLAALAGRFPRSWVPSWPRAASARVGLAAMLVLGFCGGALLARGRTSRTAGAPSTPTVRGPELSTMSLLPVVLPAPPPPVVAPQIEPLAPRAAPPPPRAVAIRRTRSTRPVSRPPAAARASETPAEAANNGKGLCLMSVESNPSKARVWVDERDTGRKTPLIAYRVPCGAHKVSLRREDLNLAHSDSINASIVAPVRRTYALR